MAPAIFLLLVNYVAALIMTGAIWLAQLSQYPLLAYVGESNFVTYEQAHIQRISGVAWSLIYLELITGFGLLFVPTPHISFFEKLVGFALVALIWLVTAFVQFPLHGKLAKGFDPHFHRKLVRTNWVRTVAWTLLAIMWTVLIGRLLS